MSALAEALLAAQRQAIGALSKQYLANRDDDATDASEAQWKLLRRLADERGAPAPDGPLTVEQASKVIEELKAGTYNADAWSIPF